MFLENKKNTFLIVTLAVVLFGAFFFGIQYTLEAKQVSKLQQDLSLERTNVKVAAFLNLFIQKVLKTDKEISFEDRLQLENAIRDINDPILLAKWEAFTQANSETDIQARVKDLLEALVKKIHY